MRPRFRSGLSTHALFQHSIPLIQKQSPLSAVHYSLKRSLFELGPAGEKFELYFARFMQELGYQTQNRQTLKGQDVSHEIDVIGKKNDQAVLVECKFHNHQGTKNDVKLPLYVKARFDDINAALTPHPFDELWIASNTSFTKDAILYANFHHIKLWGANTPVQESFLDLIKKLKLYPLTSLKNLKRQQIEFLWQKGYMTVLDFYHGLCQNKSELHFFQSERGKDWIHDCEVLLGHL